MSSFTDRCEQEDEADRLELVTGRPQVSLAYDRQTGELIGQVCSESGYDRARTALILAFDGFRTFYVRALVSTISIEAPDDVRYVRVTS